MDNKKNECPNCKKEVDKNSKFCKECGTELKKEEQVSIPVQQIKPKSSSITIAGFVCALCGIITFGISSFVGLVLSIIGFEDSKKKGNNDGLALAGIIISSILILVLGAPFAYGFIDGLTSEISEHKTEEKQPEVIKKKIKVIDFREMSKDDIKTWCDENNINCYFNDEYSNTVEVNGFVSQSIEAGADVEEYGSITIVYSLGIEPTISQKNAVRKAKSYLRHIAFSREGLIEQLEYEKYSHEDAEYAVDHITVDWNEQAVKKAESYLRHSAFSRDGLIDQLLYEGFTYDQAVYGVEQNGL